MKNPALILAAALLSACAPEDPPPPAYVLDRHELTVEEAIAEAKADIAAGTMRVKGFGFIEDSAPGSRIYDYMLARRGLTFAGQGCVSTPATRAAADAYNAVITAELERRHGRGFWKRFNRQVDKAQESLPPELQDIEDIEVPIEYLIKYPEFFHLGPPLGSPSEPLLAASL